MGSEPVIDALADVLKTIRLTGSAYFCSDFTSPWAMDVAASNQGLFHVVVNGRCYLQVENSEAPIHLQQGDIVAFPTGGAHWIGDHEKSRRLPAAQVVESILAGDNPFGSSEEKTPAIHTLLCGSFSYDNAIKHPLLNDLPCFVHIAAAQTPELGWLRDLLQVLSREARQPSPGSSIIVDRLTEVLFIQLMRHQMAGSAKELGYMAALNDAQIGKALNLIHGEQDADLTVERLADAVALSRTAFSDKFSKMVGMSPKSYLLNWRMQRAKLQLQEKNLKMMAVAENAGYASEASFSKAFKNLFSLTPGQFRNK